MLLADLMFTPDECEALRAELVERGKSDPRVSAAAITGSAAAGTEDRWSDIDVAFAVDPASELPTALSEWTTYMYDRHSAIHHVDVKAGSWIYRVFLLANTLQVDLAFVPATEFRALAPIFRVLFGKANEPMHATPPRPADVIGLAWLYALHARSSIARGKLWQAEYMISGIRDNALALACIRYGLSAAHGRGIDGLPKSITAQFEGSLVRQLDISELGRAFAVAVEGLLGEIRSTDQELFGRLRETLTCLCNTAT